MMLRIKTDRRYKKEDLGLIHLSDLENLSEGFASSGEIVADGRNTIKQYRLPSGQRIAVKKFKVPNLLNKYIYRWFRKSKAQRAFENSQKLMELGIDTPGPIAFIEALGNFRLFESYYTSEYTSHDFTLRELDTWEDSIELEKILKAFAKFTFEMHEKGIEFLDYSPGNTLIKKNEDGTFKFYLVDVNRMKFYKKPLSFCRRMKNMARISRKPKLIAIMCEEYARYIGKSKDVVFREVWFFSRLYIKKRDLRKKLNSTAQSFC